MVVEAGRGGTAEGSAALGNVVASGIGREALLTLASCRLGSEAMGTGLYVDSPNVFLYWSAFSSDEEERVRQVLGFDIVANGIGVLPRPEVKPFQARVRQGVMDTAAEAVLLPILTAGGPVTDNPSELAARRSGLAWVPVRSEDDPAWKTMAVPEDAKAHLLKALGEGRIVLLPVGEGGSWQDGELSWWQIDPATGETLGVGRRGWGQSASEYLMASAGSAGFGVGVALFWCYRSGTSLGSNDCQCLILVNALLGALAGPLFLHLAGHTVLTAVLHGVARGEALTFVGVWGVGTWWIKQFCKA